MRAYHFVLSPWKSSLMVRRFRIDFRETARNLMRQLPNVRLSQHTGMIAAEPPLVPLLQISRKRHQDIAA
jgi:hypothetical protein